jgi:RNA polymerase sigma-70 factor, ECF subfamily
VKLFPGESFQLHAGKQPEGLRSVNEQRNDDRERPGRYLPVDRRRAALFVADWEPAVRAWLRRMRAEEESVLYLVFDRALAALPRFRGESRLSTRLYRICYREALRHLEREKRLTSREAPLEAASDAEADESFDPERLMARRENAETVARALALLEPRDRELIALRYMEDLKLREVADRLELPLGTVKVRIHRALGRLRKELDHEA